MPRTPPAPLAPIPLSPAPRARARGINTGRLIVQSVARWTLYLALLGGWIGAILGSRFDIQSPAIYSEIGLIFGAAAGMGVGLILAGQRGSQSH